MDARKNRARVGPLLVFRTIFVMCTYLNGQEERARIMRRTVARYMLFGLILIMRAVSVAVMKRFPTMDHIIEAGEKKRKRNREKDKHEGVKLRRENERKNGKKEKKINRGYKK